MTNKELTEIALFFYMVHCGLESRISAATGVSELGDKTLCKYRDKLFAHVIGEKSLDELFKASREPNGRVKKEWQFKDAEGKTQFFEDAMSESVWDYAFSLSANDVGLMAKVKASIHKMKRLKSQFPQTT